VTRRLIPTGRDSTIELLWNLKYASSPSFSVATRQFNPDRSGLYH